MNASTQRTPRRPGGAIFSSDVCKVVNTVFWNNADFGCYQRQLKAGFLQLVR